MSLHLWLALALLLALGKNIASFLDNSRLGLSPRGLVDDCALDLLPRSGFYLCCLSIMFSWGPYWHQWDTDSNNNSWFLSRTINYFIYTRLLDDTTIWQQGCLQYTFFVKQTTFSLAYILNWDIFPHKKNSLNRLIWEHFSHFLTPNPTPSSVSYALDDWGIQVPSLQSSCFNILGGSWGGDLGIPL